MVGNGKLLFQLRWIAIAIQVVGFFVASRLNLPLNEHLYLSGLFLQIGVNGWAYLSLQKSTALSENKLFSQLGLDLISLNLFIMASGGLANPFSGLFLIQAVLAAMLLSGYRLLVLIIATGMSYTFLLLSFNPSCADHTRWMAFHLQGMIVNHVLTTVVVGYFIAKIVQNLRLKEIQLSARNSLISAGATAAQLAHKLGSPLNSVALLAQDLNQQNLDQDKPLILSEINRAKTYLSSIFKRLERLDNTTPDTLLKPQLTSFFSESQARYPSLALDWDLQQDRITKSISVELIRLILDILIENAAEANASSVNMKLNFTKTHLHLVVQNDGPPLPDEIQTLMKAGYSENKNQAHTGMGLFLARLVLENLNASLTLLPHEGVFLDIHIPIESVCSV